MGLGAPAEEGIGLPARGRVQRTPGGGTPPLSDGHSARAPHNTDGEAIRVEPGDQALQGQPTPGHVGHAHEDALAARDQLAHHAGEPTPAGR